MKSMRTLLVVGVLVGDDEGFLRVRLRKWVRCLSWVYCLSWVMKWETQKFLRR